MEYGSDTFSEITFRPLFAYFLQKIVLNFIIIIKLIFRFIFERRHNRMKYAH